MLLQVSAIFICAVFSFLFNPVSKKKYQSKLLVFLSTFSFFLLMVFLIFKGHKIDSHLITLTNTLSIIFLGTAISFRCIPKKKMALASSIFLCLVSILWWHGYLDPIFTLAKQYRMKIGSGDISLYIFFQACAVLSFSIWGAYLISTWFETFLQKSAFQASIQILFSKFFKIFVFFLALLWGLSLIGIDISVFAFFGGAVALGIGFGLQNIVSNLICGVILLLDRSIKPGDVIVLNEGKIIGVIHKLTARYVALRTQEGKEHLVPNDYFVKNKVENWSYSDRLIRVALSLKIPFESNLDEIKKLLYQAVSYEKRALKIPSPSVRFTEFIENAIEVQLRIWIADPEKGVSEIRSSLIYTIWRLFKENNIQIPYTPIDVFIQNERIKSSR